MKKRTSNRTLLLVVNGSNGSRNNDRQAERRVGWKSRRNSVSGRIKQSPTFAKNTNKIASTSFLEVYWDNFVSRNFSAVAPNSWSQNIKGSMWPTIQPKLHSRLALPQLASQSEFNFPTMFEWSVCTEIFDPPFMSCPVPAWLSKIILIPTVFAQFVLGQAII